MEILRDSIMMVKEAFDAVGYEIGVVLIRTAEIIPELIVSVGKIGEEPKLPRRKL